jgi:small-conductance mechanosensitive channel
MKSFKGTFFYIQYPDNWELEIIENIPSLYRPDGPGALLIVAFRYEDQIVDTKRELLRYLKSRNIHTAENRITTYELNSDLMASAIEFIHEERFWFANMVGKDHKYILFLWNSDEIPPKDLALEMSEIIKSTKYY